MFSWRREHAAEEPLIRDVYVCKTCGMVIENVPEEECPVCGADEADLSQWSDDYQALGTLASLHSLVSRPRQPDGPAGFHRHFA